MKIGLAVVSVVVAGIATAQVGGHDDHRGNDQRRNDSQRVFRVELSGYSEVPLAFSTPARGQFYAIVNGDGTGFTYWLSYSGFPTAVTQAHIHFGQNHTTGGISVWLCKTATNAPMDAVIALQTPDCDTQTTSGPISAQITAEDVVGPTGQGIAPTEFAEILAAMRAGVAYVNVHSTAFPGGEIRGQTE